MRPTDEASENAQRQVLRHLFSNSSTAEASWISVRNGTPVRAQAEIWTGLEEPAFNIVVGRAGENPNDHDLRVPVDGDWEDHDDFRFGLTLAEVLYDAPLDAEGLEATLPILQRKTDEAGTARDPRRFAEIAADHLQDRRPGIVNLTATRDIHRAMDRASNETTRPGAISEFVTALPRDLRLSLDFARADDSELVRRAADVAVHRIAPERYALGQYLQTRSRTVERDVGPAR